MNEVLIRGLTDEFLHNAPYPYRNKRTGKWMIWSFKRGCDVEVKSLI